MTFSIKFNMSSSLTHGQKNHTTPIYGWMVCTLKPSVQPAQQYFKINTHKKITWLTAFSIAKSVNVGWAARFCPPKNPNGTHKKTTQLREGLDGLCWGAI